MATDLDVIDALGRLGGQAKSHELRALTSRRAVRAAVATGQVVRMRRDTIALPVLDETAAVVRELRASRSHLSAALHHGWEVAAPPIKPMLTVPRTAHVPAGERARARIFWSRLTHEELETGVTAPARTVIDCARILPFAEALAVADSALRSGTVRRRDLLAAADASPRTGRTRAQHVVGAADHRAANPFESVLRAIALGVPGLAVEPQVHIGGHDFIGAADLVDVRLGIVIEAESWAYHGDRAPFDRDVRRYTAMVRAGWLVVRFVWADVRRDPDGVAAVLMDLVALAVGSTDHPA